MQTLIDELSTQIGITPAQAQGGAAAIFNAAKERMGNGQFDRLLGKVPGMNDLLGNVPRAGGMFGGLASLAGKVGGGDMAQAAQLLASAQSIGLDKATLMKFVPVVLKYLEAHGGPQLVQQVRDALKL